MSTQVSGPEPMQSKRSLASDLAAIVKIALIAGVILGLIWMIDNRVNPMN